MPFFCSQFISLLSRCLPISVDESICLVGDEFGVIIMLLPWASSGDEAIGLSVNFSGSVKKLVNPFEDLLFCNREAAHSHICIDDHLERSNTSHAYNTLNYHILRDP